MWQRGPDIIDLWAGSDWAGLIWDWQGSPVCHVPSLSGTWMEGGITIGHAVLMRTSKALGHCFWKPLLTIGNWHLYTISIVVSHMVKQQVWGWWYTLLCLFEGEKLMEAIIQYTTLPHWVVEWIKCVYCIFFLTLKI